MSVSICLDVPAGRRVGSYHGELLFSPAEAIVVRTDKPAGGMRADNARTPGKVSFAGAVPNGLGSSVLITVVLRPTHAGQLASARLHMLELNDIAGTSVLAASRIDSIAPAAAPKPCPARSAAKAPLLRRLVPSVLSVSSGDQTPIVVEGCGFAATNTVVVGPSRFTGIRSSNGGTRLQFTVPTTGPGTGEVAPMAMPTGVVKVQVITSRGRSNALSLTLQ
jgi:hypothetical protein